MSRPVRDRLDISLTFEATTPLRVAVGDTGDDVAADLDRRLATDGLGRWIVPATTWTGWLRAWAVERGFPDADVAHTLGVEPSPDRDQSAADESEPAADGAGQASVLTVDDALVEATHRELRWQTGIDRTTGAAAADVLVTHEEWPAGARLTLHLDVEVTGEPGLDLEVTPDAALGLLATLLRWLRTHPLALGAATSRGLGELALVDEDIRRLPVAGDGAAAALRELVADGSDTLADAAADLDRHAHPVAEPCRLEITIAWSSHQPVFCRDPLDAAVHLTPYTTRLPDGRCVLTLPATAVIGSLRSHAERLVRTLTTPCDAAPTDAAGHDDHGGGGTAAGPPHHRQIAEPLVVELFGAARTREEDTTRSRLTGRDVRGRQPVPAATLQHMRNGHALADGWTIETHTTVDRWTGGPVALFQVLTPPTASGHTGYEPMRLTVELHRLQHRPDGWAALGLLFLVLCDLQDRRVPLGALTTRGAGDAHADHLTVTATGALPPPTPAPTDGETPPADWAIDPPLWAAALQAWRRWAATAPTRTE
jgi:CRISPR/Cas system CSM-associated protein Csm3 (group 7 of RAMP superfamily)